MLRFAGIFGVTESEAHAKNRPATIAIIHHLRPSAFVWIKKRYAQINLEEALAVVQTIRGVPDDRPIHLILHTLGGLSIAGEMIAQAIKLHKASVTAYIPYYAMSAGTVIALATERVVFGRGAALGPIDSQYYGFPVDSYIDMLKRKRARHIDDATLLIALSAKKVIADDEKVLCDLINKKHGHGDPCKIARYLASGIHNHGYRVTFDKAKQLGINVATGVPQEYFELVDRELTDNDAENIASAKAEHDMSAKGSED